MPSTSHEQVVFCKKYRQLPKLTAAGLLDNGHLADQKPQGYEGSIGFFLRVVEKRCNMTCTHKAYLPCHNQWADGGLLEVNQVRPGKSFAILQDAFPYAHQAKQKASNKPIKSLTVSLHEK